MVEAIRTQRTQSSGVWLWSSLDTTIAVSATLLCLYVVYSGPRAVTFSAVFSERLSVKNFLLLTLFLVLWTGIHHLSGLYRKPMQMSCRSLLSRASSASALGSIFFLLFPLLSRERQSAVYMPVFIFFAAACFGSLVLRSVLWSIFPKISDPHQRPLRTLIIGSGPIAARLLQSLNVDSKHLIVGFVDTPGAHTVSNSLLSSFLGSYSKLEQVLMSTAVDEVLIALPLRSCYDQIQASIDICERSGVPVSYHFQPFSHVLGFAQVQERALYPYISWRPSRIEEATSLKRLTDIVGASAALLVFSPLFIMIASLIKLTTRGPIFFSQERYGLRKQRFRMFKFRTMVPDAEARQAGLESRNEAQGPVFKIKDDPRITAIGRFLRRSSLDELPQLINVCRGDMSLVGPRPLPMRDVAKFQNAWLMRRFSVKPGMTCLWQVRGRSGTTFDEWIAYDLEYIDNWTPMLDCKILLMTIPAVLRGNGAL